MADKKKLLSDEPTNPNPAPNTEKDLSVGEAGSEPGGSVSELSDDDIRNVVTRAVEEAPLPSEERRQRQFDAIMQDVNQQTRQSDGDDKKITASPAAGTKTLGGQRPPQVSVEFDRSRTTVPVGQHMNHFALLKTPPSDYSYEELAKDSDRFSRNQFPGKTVAAAAGAREDAPRRIRPLETSMTFPVEVGEPHASAPEDFTADAHIDPDVHITMRVPVKGSKGWYALYTPTPDGSFTHETYDADDSLRARAVFEHDKSGGFHYTRETFHEPEGGEKVGKSSSLVRAMGPWTQRIKQDLARSKDGDLTIDPEKCAWYDRYEEGRLVYSQDVTSVRSYTYDPVNPDPKNPVRTTLAYGGPVSMSRAEYANGNLTSIDVYRLRGDYAHESVQGYAALQAPSSEKVAAHETFRYDDAGKETEHTSTHRDPQGIMVHDVYRPGLDNEVFRYTPSTDEIMSTSRVYKTKQEERDHANDSPEEMMNATVPVSVHKGNVSSFALRSGKMSAVGIYPAKTNDYSGYVMVAPNPSYVASLDPDKRRLGVSHIPADAVTMGENGRATVNLNKAAEYGRVRLVVDGTRYDYLPGEISDAAYASFEDASKKAQRTGAYLPSLEDQQSKETPGTGGPGDGLGS